MQSDNPNPRSPWLKPRLMLLGDIRDVAGGPAPSTQANPGGNALVAGKS